MSQTREITGLRDYTVFLVTHVNADGAVVETYEVRDRIGGRVEYVGKSYEVAYRKAVFLQEMIAAVVPPTDFVKLPLVSIGSLSIYRTVRKRHGDLEWIYTAEDPKGLVVLTEDSYVEACMVAVNHQCAAIAEARRAANEEVGG